MTWVRKMTYVRDGKEAELATDTSSNNWSRRALQNINPNKLIYLACGDSTTEQFGGNDGWGTIYTLFKAVGQALEFAKAGINMGGSGHQMFDWVNGAADPNFTGPDVENPNDLGVGNWDTFFHKPTGAVTLNTSIQWRNAINQEYPVVWVICYGLNDVLLNGRGNDSEDSLVYYYSELLETAISRILLNNKSDFIVIRQPNQMYARPFNDEGFPSSTIYPEFGDVLQDDIDLVNKWNRAIARAYRNVTAKFERTFLLEVQKSVFGLRDASYNSDDLPFMNDIVHPSLGSVGGYQQIFKELIRQQFGEDQAVNPRLVEAEGWTDNLPWLHYSNYLEEKPESFQRVLNTSLITVGTTFIDFGPITKTEFDELTLGYGTIYLSVTGLAGVRFTGNWQTSSVGANTRIFNVTIPVEIQAAIAGQEVNIYIDRTAIRSVTTTEALAATGSEGLQVFVNDDTTPQWYYRQGSSWRSIADPTVVLS
jgi:hypothetical protein